jgi:hypothetical protein
MSSLRIAGLASVAGVALLLSGCGGVRADSPVGSAPVGVRSSSSGAPVISVGLDLIAGCLADTLDHTGHIRSAVVYAPSAADINAVVGPTPPWDGPADVVVASGGFSPDLLIDGQSNSPFPYAWVIMPRGAFHASKIGDPVCDGSVVPGGWDRMPDLTPLGSGINIPERLFPPYPPSSSPS